MKKIRLLRGILSLLVFMWMPVMTSEAAAETIYNSPYVSFSPDRKAWTTNAGDRDYTWYSRGTTVDSGIESAIRALEKGEHYYKVPRVGTIPVGHWDVEFKPGACIHNEYPVGNWHDIAYGTNKCMGFYYSGWAAYCADCGEQVVRMHFYMSKEAAASIDYLEVGKDMDYYYLCPYCTNLEQGSGLLSHECNAISWNSYKVKYESNTGNSAFGGYMENSIHMYNNATKYEGENVTPVTKLTKNAYTRIGYEFVEWNTEPDGSGSSYTDEEEIYNLTDKDANVDGEEGIVTLYAQWRRSSNTLRIDPNGGSYQGKSDVTVITQDYGSTYAIDGTELKPPAGYTVSFETNGGEAVASITGTQHFVEWSRKSPFAGKLLDGKYSFVAPDGNSDTIIAGYACDSIKLPETSKPNMSFGGWYYDEEFEELAGGPEDSIIPDEDMTLFAQWVDLKLAAENNYSVNGGKGAVDLSWNQADRSDKSYILYQSRNGEDWIKINDVNDINNNRTVEKTFGFVEGEKNYRIPYTGLYTMCAEGAQGGNYGSFEGGLGGRISAKFWLQKGELVTYAIGGQNGYNGGGAAKSFANGGGCTVVSTDKKGIILVAGGGGGATLLENGGSGGSSANILSTGIQGENGSAGGGGGYRGGRAGDAVYHHHTPLMAGEKQNACYIKVEGYDLANTSFYQNIYGKDVHSVETDVMSIYCHSMGTENGTYIRLGRQEEPIMTEGAESVTIGLYALGWGSLSADTAHTNMTLTIYNQDGKMIYNRKGFHGISDSGEYVTTSTCSDTVTVPLDTSTTGIYILSSLDWHARNSWLKHQITGVKFGSSIKDQCLYEEGELEKAYPAYGGTSYVNTAYSKNYSENPGARKGDGTFSIKSEKIGYVESQELKGVIALDEAAPDKISLGAVQKEAVGNNRVKISWSKPIDNGTDYYHVAESYLSGGENPVCRSNITKNHLVSGIKGYFYLLDESTDSIADENTGTFLSGNASGGKLVMDLTSEALYLHIAPVDIAGNVGGTEHIRVGSVEEADGIQWKLYTEQLAIEEGENVYPAPQDKTYFVRSDGATPFTLHYQGYMDGPATLGYQPNHMIYESEADGLISRNVFSVASEAVHNKDIDVDVIKVTYAAMNKPLLERGNYMSVARKNKSRQLSAIQNFTLSPESSGKEITLMPVVGADYLGDVVYSDSDDDRGHALVLIADGEAPVIEGLKVLENMEVINRDNGTIALQIMAVDELSGVRDFYLEIFNSDNVSEKVFRADTDGVIRVDITKDEPIFSGDFTATVYAVDNVGNESTEKYSTTEFALEATVERILSPHEPVFQCGESGLLTITTWGYADYVEVEFPEEMTALHEDMNKTFSYRETPQYKQQDTMQFMIPLYTPSDAEYVITVRAYKGDKMLEEFPCISTVSVQGSILDDIRTRLR